MLLGLTKRLVKEVFILHFAFSSCVIPMAYVLSIPCSLSGCETIWIKWFTQGCENRIVYTYTGIIVGKRTTIDL